MYYISNHFRTSDIVARHGSRIAGKKEVAIRQVQLSKRSLSPAFSQQSTTVTHAKSAGEHERRQANLLSRAVVRLLTRTPLQCPRLPCSRASSPRLCPHFATGIPAPRPLRDREEEDGRRFSPSPGPRERTRPASPTASSTTSRVCRLHRLRLGPFLLHCLD